MEGGAVFDGIGLWQGCVTPAVFVPASTPVDTPVMFCYLQFPVCMLFYSTVRVSFPIMVGVAPLAYASVCALTPPVASVIVFCSLGSGTCLSSFHPSIHPFRMFVDPSVVDLVTNAPLSRSSFVIWDTPPTVDCLVVILDPLTLSPPSHALAAVTFPLSSFIIFNSFNFLLSQRQCGLCVAWLVWFW